MKSKTLQRAFSLIELLVVIVILALLVAVIMPSLAKSKEMSRRVVRASNQRQIAFAMAVYAEEHDQYLPSFDMTDFDPYAHNVERTFVECLEDGYDIPLKMFYCPSLSKSWIESAQEVWGGFNGIVLGYNIWAQRFCAVKNVQCPPDYDCTWPLILDTTGPFQGPRKTTEKIAKTNPIIADQMSTRIALTVDFVNINNNPLSKYFPHQWNGKVNLINQVFIDGRIEQVNADSLSPRYGTGSGGWWEWR